LAVFILGSGRTGQRVKATITGLNAILDVSNFVFLKQK
jgi:hypothetical protein